MKQFGCVEVTEISRIEYVMRLLDAKGVKYELVNHETGEFRVGECDTYICATEPMSKLMKMIGRCVKEK